MTFHLIITVDVVAVLVTVLATCHCVSTRELRQGVLAWWIGMVRDPVHVFDDFGIVGCCVEGRSSYENPLA